MAENNTKIVISAEDRASAILGSVTGKLAGMEKSAVLASSALAAIGVSFSGAAMVAFVKGTIDAADGFNDLAQRIGIGIKELAGWTLAANQSGTSMESVAKGVKTLSGYMIEHREKLAAAGVTATDANGALIQLADLFKALPDGIIKTELATKLFGKAGIEMIPMLNQGSAGLKEAQEKAAEYGRKMAELAPMADQFNDQMEELALQSKAAGLNITGFFLPGLIGVSKWLNDIASNGARAQTALEFLDEKAPLGFGLRWTTTGALAGVGGAGLSRSASGQIGSKPAGMSLADEESLGEANWAGMIALGIIDPPKSPGAAKTPLQRALEEQQKRIAALNAVAGDEQTVSVDSITRQYDESLRKKAEAMDEAHEKRLEQQRIESEGEESIRLQMEKTSRELAKQKDMASDLGLTFASAFEDAVIGGKNLQSVLGGLAQDVARIFLRKTVTEPMANSLSGLFKDFDISKFFGGARASGGPVSSGQAYLVGEQGPELFMPGASGAIIPNGGGMGGITVNLVEDRSRAGQVKQGSSGGQPMLTLFVEQIRGAIAGDIASGSGPIPAALAGTYGLNRAAGGF